MSSFDVHPMLTQHDDTRIAWQQACVPVLQASRAGGASSASSLVDSFFSQSVR